MGLALRWSRQGIDVVIGSRDEQRARNTADEIRNTISGARCSGAENADATASAGTVVVAVPFAGQAAIYRSIAEHVDAESVVVDCTAPLAAAVGGRAFHVL